MRKCDAKCAADRRAQCRELQKHGRNLLMAIGLEQISFHFLGRQGLQKLDASYKEAAKYVEDWDHEERCQWCDGSRIGVHHEPLAEDFDPLPELKKLHKKKTEPQLFVFDNIPNSSSVPDPFGFPSAFALGALFNPFFGMPNTMFPAWLNQASTNSHSNPRMPLDAETMQRYMNEWRSQLMNANMMSYLLRAPNLMNPSQFPSNTMASIQNQLLQQFQQYSRMNNLQEIKPFVLKDPPKKAGGKAKSSEGESSVTGGQDEPLDLSAKRNQADGKVLEDDDQTSAGSVELNDKSSSPECSEAGSKLTKRNYTQQALNDAVTEILSGRLGTRRASVVYGIPRSTLRNKIYKLESIDELNGVLKKRKMKKGDESVTVHNNNAGLLKPVKEDDEFDQDVLLHKTNSMPSMDSPSLLPFASLSSSAALLSQLPGNLSQLNSLNPLTDLLKQYVGVKTENGVSKESSISPPTENSSDEMEKRPRPKRGQYRKYDKGALEKAVLSVRKGEMSVHRAGSFYGVPHSTLEYKVKERNLLRGKRRQNGEKKLEEEDQNALQKAFSISNLESKGQGPSIDNCNN